MHLEKYLGLVAINLKDVEGKIGGGLKASRKKFWELLVETPSMEWRDGLGFCFPRNAPP